MIRNIVSALKVRGMPAHDFGPGSACFPKTHGCFRHSTPKTGSPSIILHSGYKGGGFIRSSMNFNTSSESSVFVDVEVRILTSIAGSENSICMVESSTIIASVAPLNHSHLASSFGLLQ